MEEVGDGGGEAGGLEEEDHLGSGFEGGGKREGAGGQDEEFDGFEGQGGDREMANGPVGVVKDREGGGEVEGGEVADGGEECCAEEGDDDGFGTIEIAEAVGERRGLLRFEGWRSEG